jgi:hypothetical protein
MQKKKNLANTNDCLDIKEYEREREKGCSSEYVVESEDKKTIKVFNEQLIVYESEDKLY